MSTPNVRIAYPLSVNPEGGRSTAWWGVVLLIAAEATLFAAFLASYFYLASGAIEWPPDGIEPPKLVIPIIASILLIGSSIPMAWAERRIQEGNRTGLRIGLLIAFLMAAVFAGLQIYEYRHEQFSFSQNSYSGLFFTITGLHGAHVLSALAMNAYLQLRAWRGHFTKRRYIAVSNVTLYWHFVDAVWVFIFISLYLAPRWLP
jgi:cytochrome c oxidase subunit 3